MGKDNGIGTDTHTYGLGWGRNPDNYEYEPKRYKGRCRFYSYEGNKCTCNYGWLFKKNCLGSGNCTKYEQITEEEFIERQKENRKKRRQEAKSIVMAGAPAGTDAETPSESLGRRYKGRCRFYSYDGDRCRCKTSPCYKSKCKGSGGCREYQAISEGWFKRRQNVASIKNNSESGSVGG